MKRFSSGWLKVDRNTMTASGRPMFSIVGTLMALSMLAAACDTGGNYRQPPPPTPSPTEQPPPPTPTPTPTPTPAAECTLDVDCIGVMGDLGDCAFAICTSAGQCVASNAANGTPCSDSGCATGTCFAGTCAPEPGSCGPTTVEPVCGDGVCDAGEDCSLCPSDCGTCNGDCCSDNGSIGCFDPDIVDCVCASDPYCCDTAWDAECVAKVDTLGCGSCAEVPFCGDGICDAGDTCSNCVQDCGVCETIDPYCGDGICDAGDTCANCAQDCGSCPPPAPFCGDGICDAGDTCNNCVQDCGACPPPAPFCGDGLCNGGESCGACPTDCGVCPPPEPFCGDGVCGAGEDCSLCPTDCGLCAGNCCDDNGTIGCVDPAIVDCVCADDPYCCDTEWDGECAAKVDTLGCGTCEVAPFCGDGICDAGDTCSNCPQDCGVCPPPEPFCGDGICDAGDNCLNCAQDCGVCPPPEPFCGDGICDAGDNCANCAEDCGVCPPPEPFCGDGYCDAGDDCANCPLDCGVCEGDCCAANGDIGCEDDAVTQCVCDLDDYCCTEAWDEECAALAETSGCATCSTDAVCGDGFCEGNEDGAWCPEDCGELAQDCCGDVGAVGCSDPFIEACVCEADSYCCDVAWDDTCAAQVDELGCGFCAVQPQ